MPIQTNFAIETALLHVPIPATKAQVRRLNATWNRQPPKSGRITARHTLEGLILNVVKPVVLLAVADDYWRELGRLIKRTGEPWWDLCAVILDSQPQKKKPHAHALSLYRITDKGEMHSLYSDLPEALWPEAYPRQRRSSPKQAKKLLKKWRFAPDLFGIVSGPRDLSKREGFGHRPAKLKTTKI